MAVYRVGSDGKAPGYATAGDYILTNGGTYQVGQNGKGVRVADYTPANYGGQYGAISPNPNISEAQKYAQSNSLGSIHAGQGNKVTNYGEGELSFDPKTGSVTRSLNGRSYYVNKGDEKYNSIYDEYVKRYGSPVNPQVVTETAINDTANLEVPKYTEPDMSKWDSTVDDVLASLDRKYSPVDPNRYMGDVMTMDDALALATQLLDPNYTAARERSLNSAYANLDRAGLYNSLYGQNLAMSADNQLAAQQQQAINDLALSLVNQDRERAMQLYRSAIDENQFAANYRQSGLSTSLSASMQMIDSLLNRARAQNNADMEAAGLELEKQAQVLDAQYRAGLLTNSELQNQLLELQIKAMETELANGGTGGGGGGSGVPQSIIPPALDSSSVTPVANSSANNAQYRGVVDNGNSRYAPSAALASAVSNGGVPAPLTPSQKSSIGAGSSVSSTGDYGPGLQPYEYSRFKTDLTNLMKKGYDEVALQDLMKRSEALNKKQFDELYNIVARGV